MKYLSVLLVLALYVGLIVFVSNKKISQTVPVPTSILITVIPTKAVLGEMKSKQDAKCYSDGILPDSTCTPGSIDPNVTQENIYQTICVAGYTKTVRPDVSYTNKLKSDQIAEYGFTDTNPRDYEEDHLISLELGGSPSDPKNLWPEPGSSPNPKDRIENLCHQKVCTGQIQLSQAQKEIATNWQTACQ